MRTKKPSTEAKDNAGLPALLRSLHGLIQEARQQVLRSVDAVRVRTCWEIGRHIVEFEQGGTGRAEHGKRLLEILARNLTTEFRKGSLYPWHRYFSDSDAIWLAIELHPIGSENLG